MVASLGLTAATTMGGLTGGMVMGETLGAIPTTANVPATGGSAKPKVTASGTPVNPTATPRQSLWMSAAIVIGALCILVLGSRYFKDARIG